MMISKWVKLNKKNLLELGEKTLCKNDNNGVYNIKNIIFGTV